METQLLRAWICPVFLLILVISPFTRAVDPIDFLESLKDDEDPTQNHNRESSSTEYPNGVNVIPGEAEVNYPVYSTIPKSSFSCIGRPVGFYADTELRCQVWHICDEDHRQQSFLCTNGTVYSQEKRVCDWWYNVNCDPNEVSRNYLQNYDLYKGPPPKTNDDQDQQQNEGSNNNKNNDSKNGDRNDFDYQPTTKPYNKDPFSQFQSSRQTAESQQKPRFNSNNDQQYTKPTPSYNEPFPTREAASSNNNDFPQPRRQPSQTRPTTTSTTTYRPPTTYATPPPPAALQGNSYRSQPQQQQQQRSNHNQQPQQQQQQRSNHNQQPQQQQRQQSQQQQKPQQPSTPAPSRSVPSIKTTNANGKRIVEIRVPVSQIPPEILAKYGKRIPEHILKEIFLNFTRNQQQELKQEAIGTAKPSNPLGVGNNRSPPPNAPIPQNRQSNSPPPPHPSKKPVDFGGSSSNNNKPASFSGNKNSHPAPPPPPPPPSEPQQKFRHSTPRKVDNVKFATPTRELLDQYDDERQQVGESQNPIYSLQQLFSTQHSRTSGKSRAPQANELPRVKESFNYETTTTTTPQPYQEFTRSQPRRRTQAPTSTARTTTTTEEPQLITDRYFPVASKEEKKNAEIRRIFLVAKQGIKVLPPIPVLSGVAAEEAPTARRQPPPLPVTQRPKILRTTAVPDFSRIPPVPKVSIPDDYYVQNERFEEAESRYPRPSIPPTYIEPSFHSRQNSRPTTTSIPTTTTTTTTTTPPPPPPTSFYQEPEFRRTKQNKPQQQSKKKPLPPPEEKKQEENSDYDDGSQQEVNTDELELLRLADEYIKLTGSEFGSRVL